MRLRRDQVEAMKMPPQDLRRGLRQLLQTLGVPASLERNTGDLLFASDAGGTNRISFDERGRPAGFRAVDGRLHHAAYDPQGRLAALVDSAGHQMRYRYDDSGRISEIADQAGARHEVRHPDDLSVEFRRAGGGLLRFQFTTSGRFQRLTDSRGNSSNFRYNESGLLVDVRDRGGGVTKYDYDARQRLSAIETPTGSIWRIQFAEDSQRKRVIHPDGKWEEYIFSSDVLTSVRRRDGTTASFQYHSPGRLARIDYSTGLAVGLEYDEANRLGAADNGQHVVAFEYDSEGRRAAEIVDGRRVEVRYNAQGLLSTLVTHRRQIVSFEYGADRRIAAIVDWDRERYAVHRDPRGDVMGLEFPNGARWSRLRNEAGLPETEVLALRGRRIERRYRYDENDLLTELSDSEFGTTSHRFDATDRLIEVTSPRRATDYAYDRNGNLLRIGTREFQYDPSDRLIGGSGIRCQYDGRDNLTERRDDAGTTRFHYNDQNQLIRVELPNGRIAEYEYDAFGRRVVKRVGALTTTYTWWGELLLAEDTEGPEALRVDYLYLPGTYTPLAVRRNRGTYFYEVDHLETPIRLFDRDDRVVWCAEPHGFGFGIFEHKVDQPLRFPGQYWDAETGLHYNVSRYFDPATGRYLTPDPEFFEERTNLYVYAANNPVAFIDPNGRLAPLAAAALLVVGAIAVGAAIGAAFGAAHQAASNWAHDKPIGEGVLGAAGRGAIAGASGGLGAGVGFLVGGPLGAVVLGYAGGTLASMGMAAYEAPEGHGWEACAEAGLRSIPFVGSIHNYAEHPEDPHRGAQLGVDLVFDVVALALIIFGVRRAAAAQPRWAAARAAAREVPPVVVATPPNPEVIALGLSTKSVELPGGGKAVAPDVLNKFAQDPTGRGGPPAATWTSFREVVDPDTGLVDFGQTIRGAIDDAREIHFNLEGMSKESLADILKNPDPSRFTPPSTNWELATVLNDPELAAKTTFYDGPGNPVDDPATLVQGTQ